MECFNPTKMCQKMTYSSIQNFRFVGKIHILKVSFPTKIYPILPSIYIIYTSYSNKSKINSDLNLSHNAIFNHLNQNIPRKIALTLPGYNCIILKRSCLRFSKRLLARADTIALHYFVHGPIPWPPSPL